jgi:GNAT superfamily N-acetyltransferase
MEPKIVDIDGRKISIRLMDASYVMTEDEDARGVVVDIHCRHLSPCWPNPLYSIYYRKLLEAYGVGPVFVWEAKRVVGFLPISIVACGIPELPHCVHYTGGMAYGAERHIDLSMVEKAEALPFRLLDPKEIRTGCMTLHPELRGRSLAVSMIDYMLDWARTRGWERVRARAMIDGEPQAFYPTYSFWVRLGFEPVGPVRLFGPSKDPIDRAQAIDLALDLRK